MKRTPVESSDVKSIGFERTNDIADFALRGSRGTLEIEFHRNGVYRYESVSEADYNAVMRSESIGKALHAIVKTKGYAYSKVVEISN